MSRCINADIVETIYQQFDTQISALDYYRISQFIKPLKEMSHVTIMGKAAAKWVIPIT